MWGLLPDVIVLHIAHAVSIVQLATMQLACRSWRRAVHNSQSKRAWAEMAATYRLKVCCLKTDVIVCPELTISMFDAVWSPMRMHRFR